MRAMVLERVGSPLVLRDVPDPTPGPGQVLIRVTACAVCRTDLHVVDGDLADPKLPLIPGHEIVGRVAAVGPGATLRDGDELLALAPQVPVRTQVHPYPLEQANQALDDLRAGRFEGAAVLQVG